MFLEQGKKKKGTGPCERSVSTNIALLILSLNIKPYNILEFGFY